MKLNDFDVLVLEPSEVVIVVSYVRKLTTSALQGTDKSGAETIIGAWNSALHELLDDVNTHLNTKHLRVGDQVEFDAFPADSAYSRQELRDELGLPEYTKWLAHNGLFATVSDVGDGW